MEKDTQGNPRLAHLLNGRHDLAIYAEGKRQSELVRKRRNQTIAKYCREKSKSDPAFRALRSCRVRLRLALKATGNSKSGRDMIGCSSSEFRAHIERLFTAGMTWDNYGEWVIDHIKPCAVFDFSYPTQQWECFHFSNLQPLWQRDNQMKADTWVEGLTGRRADLPSRPSDAGASW